MSAYIVFTREKTLSAAELATYWELVGPTFAGHDVKVLAHYGPHLDLEGSATEGTVIAEFPTMDAALAWYNSPAYTEVRKHRIAGAVYRGLLVQGISA